MPNKVLYHREIHLPRSMENDPHPKAHYAAPTYGSSEFYSEFFMKPGPFYLEHLFIATPFEIPENHPFRTIFYHYKTIHQTQYKTNYYTVMASKMATGEDDVAAVTITATGLKPLKEDWSAADVHKEFTIIKTYHNFCWKPRVLQIRSSTCSLCMYEAKKVYTNGDSPCCSQQ